MVADPLDHGQTNELEISYFLFDLFTSWRLEIKKDCHLLLSYSFGIKVEIAFVSRESRKIDHLRVCFYFCIFFL